MKNKGIGERKTSKFSWLQMLTKIPQVHNSFPDKTKSQCVRKINIYTSIWGNGTVKTNNVDTKNVRRLRAEGPEAGPWSLSVSLASLTFVGKKLKWWQERKEKRPKSKDKACKELGKQLRSDLPQACDLTMIPERSKYSEISLLLTFGESLREAIAH